MSTILAVTNGAIFTRFGTKRVKANTVYQEYIQDKGHLHMNSTRWVTLTGFVQYLGKAGIAHVDETEKGWFIQWIDRSPKALAKQAASAMKDRSTMSDEQRERLLIAEQIVKAEKEKDEDGGDEDEEEIERLREEGLKREEGEKVVLALRPANASSSAEPARRSHSASPSEDETEAGPSTQPTAESSSSGPGTPSSTFSAAVTASTSTTIPSTSAPTIKPGFNAFKAAAKPNALKPTGVNPLKQNVFKMATLSSSSISGSGGASSSASSKPAESSGSAKRKELSVAEQLILEDQQRKRRRMDREGLRA